MSARHSERGKKTRQTEEEVGRQYQGMDRPGVRLVPEGSGKQGEMEKTGCKIICGAPMTIAVKGLMMIMMMMMHSTREPASGRGTYFILRAYTQEPCGSHHVLATANIGEIGRCFGKM